MSAPVTALQAVVETLAACLCEQLADGPGLCFCGVLPGAAVPLDVGYATEDNAECGGMAYVRVTSVYPSTQVGVAQLQPSNCRWATGFDLELGVYRPFPLMEDGSSPPPEVQLECTRQQMWDIEAMQKTLACCDWLPPVDYVVGQYAPAGPAGGVLGGIVPVSGMLI